MGVMGCWLIMFFIGGVVVCLDLLGVFVIVMCEEDVFDEEMCCLFDELVDVMGLVFS